MKNRRLAYHHIALPDGTRQDMVVVEVDEQGNYLAHHPLQGEEAFVEWKGGTYKPHNPITS